MRLQDEMNEIREREAEGEAASKVSAEKKAHAARLHEANLNVSSPWPRLWERQDGFTREWRPDGIMPTYSAVAAK